MELIEIFKISLLVILVVCAVCASVMKRMLPAIIVFAAYSLVMSILWVLLESPDLAITEAAVGAGISGVLFYMAYRKIERIDATSTAVKEQGEETDCAAASKDDGDDTDTNDKIK